MHGNAVIYIGKQRALMPEHPYRLEHVALDGEATFHPGFAVLVVLTGEVDLEDGRTIQLAADKTAVASNPFGPLHLRGRSEPLVCRPPRLW